MVFIESFSDLDNKKIIISVGGQAKKTLGEVAPVP